MGVATLTPTLIGYFAKRTAKHPDWLKSAGVDEVCSASSCISEDPDGWIDHWRHNEMFVFDTSALALSVVPEPDRGEYELYAYRMFPLKFDRGEQLSFEIPPLHVEPLSASFRLLGYDAVSRSVDAAFECSPLSCNHMAEQVSVNRHCLVDDPETAFQLARDFGDGLGEPGPYYVVEVWRQ